MPERIKELLKALELNQTNFAKQINVSSAFIGQLIKGQSSLSDRTISDICRVYGVNEEWLRTGEGEMFRNISRRERIMALAADAADDNGFISEFVSRLARLDYEDWQAIQRIIEKMLEDNKGGKE